MKTQKPYQPPRSEKPSSPRTVWFKIISLFLPVLFFGLLEISLRFFGYGYDLSVFIESPEDKQYWVFNPHASKKYFANPAIATVGNSEPFKKQKDGNTLRLFILGESTTIGYPYFHNGSFHRWLQYRLIHTFPDKNFEIINLALTAVNSYTVRGFAREIVDYQPDAVLMYTGHNEYYGALGVGSTEKLGSNPAIVNLVLGLREWRIMQLMTNGYLRLQAVWSPAKSGGTRMQLMVADQQIPYQSEPYQKGIEQFRSNMAETLDVLSKNRIPVFVSNLVSNEKDLKPFASFPIDTTQLPGFKTNYDRGLAALKQGNSSVAYAAFRAANQVYSTHALCNYYLGQLAYNQRNFKSAKSYFSKAKDLDGLRFRAPDELNTIIRDLCRTHKNAHWVDTKTAFENRSQNGLIGDELILEHVHPDLQGYAVLSDAFYEALKKAQILSVNSGREISFGQLLRDMPITKVDSLAGVYKVTNLKQSWPFSRMMAARPFTVKSFEERLAYAVTRQRITWPDAMSQLFDQCIANHQLEAARKTVAALTLEYPNEARYFEKAAMLSGELQDNDKAVFYFKKAFALAPSFDRARYLFVLNLKQDRPLEALPYLEYAIQNNTSQFDLNPVRIYTQQVIQWQQQYARDTTNRAVLNQIATAYYKMDNKEGASKYVRKILKTDANNKDARALLAQLK